MSLPFSTILNDFSQPGLLLDSLKRVNWSFPSSSTPAASIHSLHWFPGNFIPQIPSFLIQILSNDGDIILDPFCGSGTTGVEARQLRRVSWMSDANMASVQVARGKSAALHGTAILDDVTSILEHIVWDFNKPSFDEAASETVHQTDLLEWLHPNTYGQLKHIWSNIITTPSILARDVLGMIFTDTLFTCASTGGSKTRTGKSRRHHWGWIADNVKPKTLIAHDAFKVFREKLLRYKETISRFPPFNLLEDSIKQEDARCLSAPSNSVDLIVTSPPYLGMIDYTFANRLTYLWMGWSMEADLRAEIGARRFRNRPSCVENYLAALNDSFQEMHRVLKPGKYCAIVIGSSRKYPDVVERIFSLAQRHFLLFWGPIARTPTRRRVSSRDASIPQEYIIVLSK